MEISHFFKEDIQMTSKHMKRCLTSLVIRKMPIKTTRYHFISTKMAIIKKIKITVSVNKDVEKLEPICIDDRIVKWCSFFAKQFGSSSKI